MNISIKKDGKLIKQVMLQSQPMIAGRSSSADIQLFDATISRQHLRIINNNTSVTFEDMGSRNGFFFKGQKIAQKEIFPGQNIRVGIYIISIDMLDPAEQNTMAILEEGEGKTEVMLTHDDLQFGVDELTEDAPSIENSNPLFNVHQQDTPSLAPEERGQGEDSFMQAIAVSTDVGHLEDPQSQEQEHLDTTEQSPSETKQSLSFSAIENAPQATFEDAPQVASEKENTSEEIIREDLLSTPKIDTSNASIQTKKINSDEVVIQTIENSNPLFSDASKEKEEKTPSIAFSSLQSSPSIDHEDSPRDIFQDMPPDNQAQGTQTGIVSPPSSLEHSKTKIRNFEREPSQAKPTIHPEHKKYIFFGAAVCIAICMLLLDKDVQRVLFKKQSSTVTKTAGKDETSRIVLFKIEKIKQSLEQKDLTAAKQEIKILLTQYANHPALIEYLPVFNQQKALIEEKIQIQKHEAAKKAEQITLFLQQAFKLNEEKNYDAAIETFQKVLQIDDQNPDALAGIDTTETLKVQNQRKEFAKKKKHQMLDRIYNEGVEKFEAGEFGKAKKLFIEVTEDGRHRKHASAKKFLRKIATQTDGALNQKINQARQQIESQTTLPQGHKALSSLAKQFPQHKQVKQYYQLAQTKMLKKAKQLYAQAIAQEELAGDFSTALDLYHEVLTYAPDPTSAYHKKAKEKIEKLEL